MTLAALAGLVALAGPGRSDESTSARPGPSGEPGAITASAIRAVDGDTIEVEFADGTSETVRYIGVDTPESVDPDEPVQCYAKRASEVNRSLVVGRTVTLRFDAERRDVYGRLLAYVFTGDGMVNAKLVRAGLARTLEIEPNTSRAPRFAALEAAAARRGIGLWGACG